MKHKTPDEIAEAIKAALNEHKASNAYRDVEALKDTLSSCSYLDERVYAADLRAIGCNIPEKIPDCAWVPRSSIEFGEPDVQIDGKCFDVTLTFAVSEPFRWAEYEFEIDLDDMVSAADLGLDG
jgi:hypothetical protein